MLRRDLITAEMQKLAQVLARIMGLKLEGNLEEAEELFKESLLKEFEISEDELLTDSNNEFNTLLNSKEFPAEKLEMLSQFLYADLTPSRQQERNKLVADKLLLIYQMLEEKHHIVSMVNLDRQKKIQQYLNP
ncbi:hypothetical protein [Pedobacter gandavensis]|uniref:TerB family tellurite resistance protein n=1 Tax=Pedobacter gandavensis TaxID=2679963 RepID=A0ABR6F2Y4_9SPHI|nr:hypothetical protein [Pedobacter gandavensis]MBB2151866.1 hypothetical protein [Pedobacter gandavensis]